MIVVKCGGSPDIAAGAVCGDIAGLARAGTPVLLVHGASHDAEHLAGRLGIARRTLVSPSGVRSRYTNEADLDALMMATAGRCQPRWVAALHTAGLRAVGLRAADGPIVRGERKRTRRAVVDGRSVVVRDDRGGRITGVDPTLLRVLLDSGHVPVVSTPAWAGPDGFVNIDADRLAAAIAGALGATALVFLSDVPGIQRQPDGWAGRLERVDVDDPELDAILGWRLRPKLHACREALSAGVATVVIADGRVDRPLHRALQGEGTRVGKRPRESA